MAPSGTGVERTRVRFVFGLALSVSVVANILAAESSWISRSVGAWFPLALLLVVDVLGRTPRSSGWLGWVVATATALVAFAAAVASFSHMREVALAAGESELVAVLFPLTVDGLAVVCSAALVELGRRERSAGGVVSVEDPDLAGSGGQVVSGSQRSLSDSQPVPDSEPLDSAVSVGSVGSGWVPLAAASSTNGVAR